MSINRKLADLLDANGDVKLDSLDNVSSTFAGLSDVTVSTVDPTTSTNPSATGHLWFNKATGKMFTCTDNTTGENIWKAGVEGNIAPPPDLTLDGVLQTGWGTGTALQVTTQGFYTIQVSADCTANIKLWGAAGGTGSWSEGPTSGAAGGYVTGNVTLAANTPYLLIVGQGGRGSSSGGTRAFPDGGYADTSYPEGGGGGSSRFIAKGSITNTSSSYNNTSLTYLLIAGAGGGGSGYNSSGTAGGWGGGTSGADGGRYYPSGESINSCGHGGSQSAGGERGTTGRQGGAQEDGAKYYGGNGSGSGGGGGYYGGGGSYGYYSQAGGGSGYIDANNVTDGSFLTTNSASYNLAPGSPPGNAGNGVATATSHGNDGAGIITFVSQ